MKIQLETIQYPKSQSSFHFFRREEPLFNSFRHFHPELELTYIHKGIGIRYIGDNINSFEPGDLVLIGENLPHDYVSSSTNDEHNSEAYVFQFPRSIIYNIVECHSIGQLFSEADYGIHFINPSVQLLEKIRNTSLVPTLKNFINFLDILNDLYHHHNKKIISSIAFTKNTKSRRSPEKILKVTKHIANHYQHQITINQMAQLIHMTPQSFCRWFKGSTGCSFITYLNSTRIEKACQLLLQSNFTIANISFQSGFETVSHFNRTFKKIKNMTPKEYRNQSKFQKIKY